MKLEERPFGTPCVPFRIGCMEFCTPLQPFWASQLCPSGELKPDGGLRFNHSGYPVFGEYTKPEGEGASTE